MADNPFVDLIDRLKEREEAPINPYADLADRAAERSQEQAESGVEIPKPLSPKKRTQEEFRQTIEEQFLPDDKQKRKQFKKEEKARYKEMLAENKAKASKKQSMLERAPGVVSEAVKELGADTLKGGGLAPTPKGVLDKTSSVAEVYKNITLGAASAEQAEAQADFMEANPWAKDLVKSLTKEVPNVVEQLGATIAETFPNWAKTQWNSPFAVQFRTMWTQFGATRESIEQAKKDNPYPLGRSYTSKKAIEWEKAELAARSSASPALNYQDGEWLAYAQNNVDILNQPFETNAKFSRLDNLQAKKATQALEKIWDFMAYERSGVEANRRRKKRLEEREAWIKEEEQAVKFEQRNKRRKIQERMQPHIDEARAQSLEILKAEGREDTLGADASQWPVTPMEVWSKKGLSEQAQRVQAKINQEIANAIERQETPSPTSTPATRFAYDFMHNELGDKNFAAQVLFKTVDNLPNNVAGWLGVGVDTLLTKAGIPPGAGRTMSYMAMAATEGYEFLEAGNKIGLDADINLRYAQKTGLVSGALEYSEFWLNMLTFQGAGKFATGVLGNASNAIMSATKSKITGMFAEEGVRLVGNSMMEGFEEVTQGLTQVINMSMAAKEHLARHGEGSLDIPDDVPLKANGDIDWEKAKAALKGDFVSGAQVSLGFWAGGAAKGAVTHVNNQFGARSYGSPLASKKMAQRVAAWRHAWVMENTDKAETIAKGDASRKSFEEAGLPTWNRKAREKFQQDLKDRYDLHQPDGAEKLREERRKAELYRENQNVPRVIRPTRSKAERAELQERVDKDKLLNETMTIEDTETAEGVYGASSDTIETNRKEFIEKAVDQGWVVITDADNNSMMYDPGTNKTVGTDSIGDLGMEYAQMLVENQMTEASENSQRDFMQKVESNPFLNEQDENGKTRKGQIEELVKDGWEVNVDSNGTRVLAKVEGDKTSYMSEGELTPLGMDYAQHLQNVGVADFFDQRKQDYADKQAVEAKQSEEAPAKHDGDLTTASEITDRILDLEDEYAEAVRQDPFGRKATSLENRLKYLGDKLNDIAEGKVVGESIVAEQTEQTKTEAEAEAVVEPEPELPKKKGESLKVKKEAKAEPKPTEKPKKGESLKKKAEVKAEEKTEVKPSKDIAAEPIIEEGMTEGEKKADHKFRIRKATQAVQDFMGKLEVARGAMDIEDFPIKNLLVSVEGLTQFKADADPDTGVVAGQELKGRPLDLKTDPIIVMQLKDGRSVIVTGRHRVDLFRRAGRDTIPARVIHEGDYTLQQAQLIDAIFNILDEKGTINDFIRFFDETGISAEEVESLGLTSRKPGQIAYSISQLAGERVRAAINYETEHWRKPRKGELPFITPAQAAAIANSAPINQGKHSEAIQAMALEDAYEGATPSEIAMNANYYSRIDFDGLAKQQEADGFQGDLFENPMFDAIKEEQRRKSEAQRQLLKEARSMRAILSAAANKKEALSLTKAEMARQGITDRNDNAQIKAAWRNMAERARALESLALDAKLNAEVEARVQENLIKEQGEQAPKKGFALRAETTQEIDTEKAKQTERDEIKKRIEKPLSDGEGQSIDTTYTLPGMEETGNLFNQPAPKTDTGTAPAEVVGSPAPNGDVDTSSTHHVANETEMKSNEFVVRDLPPMHAQDIAKQMQEMFPELTFKGFRNIRDKAQGLYNSKEQSVRSRVKFDIPVLSHEIFHHVNTQVLSDGHSFWSSHAPQEIKAELEALGRELYGNKVPAGGYVSEGFAEFGRMYLAGEAVDQKAPHMFEHFVLDILPNNQELAKKINTLSHMITHMENTKDAESIIRAFVKPKQRMGWNSGRVAAVLATLEHHWRDTYLKVLRAQRASGMPWDADPYTDTFQLLTAFKGTTGNMAHAAVFKGTQDLYGRQTGESLYDALSPVLDAGRGLRGAKAKAAQEAAQDSFYQYLVATATKQYADQGMLMGLTSPKHGETKEAHIAREVRLADQTLVKHDTPANREAAKRMTEWSRRLLRLQVDEGAMSNEEYNRIAKANPIYVRILRHKEQNSPRRKGEGMRKMQYRRGGSEAVHDLIEALVTDTGRMIELAKIAAIKRSMVESYKKYGGEGNPIGKWMTKVNVPIKRTVIGEGQAQEIAREVVGQTELIDSKLLNEAIEAWEGNGKIEVFQVNPQDNRRHNLMRFMVDEGVYEYYEVTDPAIYDLVNGLAGEQDLGAFTKGFRAVQSLQRFGATGLNPGFGLIRNLLRDTKTAAVTADYHFHKPVISTLQGVMLNLMQSESAMQYAYMGLGGEGYIGQNINKNKITSAQLKARTTWAKMRKAGILNLTLSALNQVEIGTRLMEYRGAFKHGMDKWNDYRSAAILAANASKDISVNFGRMGETGAKLNRYVLFMNAQIQSNDKFLRSLGVRDTMPWEKRQSDTAANRWKIAGRTLGRAAGWSMLPSLLAYYLNRDKEWWKELMGFEKWGFIHFQPGEDMQPIRIPQAFEQDMILAALPVAGIESYRTGDNKHIMEALAYTFDAIMPVDIGVGSESFQELALALLSNASAIRPLVEVSANKGFSGRNIIPLAMQHLAPRDQVSLYTTDTAKFIAGILNAGSEGGRISPIQVEHIVDGYLGGIYKRTTEPVESIFKGEAGRYFDPQNPARNWVIGTLRLETEYRNRLMNDFYNKQQELQQKKSGGRATLNELGQLKVMGQHSREMSDNYKHAREIVADHGRGKDVSRQLREYQIERNNTTRDLNKVLEEGDFRIEGIESALDTGIRYINRSDRETVQKARDLLVRESSFEEARKVLRGMYKNTAYRDGNGKKTPYGLCVDRLRYTFKGE